jgi:hypothetical protein
MLSLGIVMLFKTRGNRPYARAFRSRHHSSMPPASLTPRFFFRYRGRQKKVVEVRSVVFQCPDRVFRFVIALVFL